ncbi:MAG: HepT-like ribonuclease domain-containing protein [Bacteroidota bacterium]
MEEKLLKCLYDIKNAISEIDSFIASQQQDFDKYSGNMLLKRAIERDLEIIGEAISRLLKEDPAFPIENARRIIGLRNQIIHSYDVISDENIWSVITVHIPKLKAEVEALIGSVE